MGCRLKNGSSVLASGRSVYGMRGAGGSENTHDQNTYMYLRHGLNSVEGDFVAIMRDPD